MGHDGQQRVRGVRWGQGGVAQRVSAVGPPVSHLLPQLQQQETWKRVHPAGARGGTGGPKVGGAEIPRCYPLPSSSSPQSTLDASSSLRLSVLFTLGKCVPWWGLLAQRGAPHQGRAGRSARGDLTSICSGTISPAPQSPADQFCLLEFQRRDF